MPQLVDSNNTYLLIALLLGVALGLAIAAGYRIYKNHKFWMRELEWLKTHRQWAFEMRTGETFQTVSDKSHLPTTLFYKAKNIVDLSSKTWYRSADGHLYGSRLSDEDYDRFFAFPVMIPNDVNKKFNPAYHKTAHAEI